MARPSAHEPAVAAGHHDQHSFEAYSQSLSSNRSRNSSHTHQHQPQSNGLSPHHPPSSSSSSMLSPAASYIIRRVALSLIVSLLLIFVLREIFFTSRWIAADGIRDAQLAMWSMLACASFLILGRALRNHQSAMMKGPTATIQGRAMSDGR